MGLSGHHDRGGFSCGIGALDRYLKTQAGQDSSRRVAACFVISPFEEPDRIVGYYTLAAASVALAELPASISKQLPRYPVIPATLMGRLAVDSRFQGARLGEFLLFDAMARALRSEIASFAFIVDPKDETAARFYSRYQFLPLASGSQRMFLPIAEIAALLG
jgi:hypothetical protein